MVKSFFSQGTPLTRRQWTKGGVPACNCSFRFVECRHGFGLHHGAWRLADIQTARTLLAQNWGPCLRLQAPRHLVSRGVRLSPRSDQGRHYPWLWPVPFGGPAETSYGKN